MTAAGRHCQIIVFNAGSSSIKFAIFGQTLDRLISGSADEIGRKGRLVVGDVKTPGRFGDHAAALDAILAGLFGHGFALEGMTAAAHRVVHGGAELSAPRRLDDATIAVIEACIPLAPLHNPHNLTVIRAVAAAAPGLPQFASFDTSFHTTNPEVALRYAIPESEDARGIRRYGFHGISYSGIARNLPALTGEPMPARLLALHLGNGVSLCAIRDGRSVATTMGYSPLDGLTMGTRSGGIDGNAVLRMVADHGIDATYRILNRESGLLALGGHSDMRPLRSGDDARSRFAVAHFCYWAVRHAGSMIAAMGGLDAVAFTGGIGENDVSSRAAIMTGLKWAGLRFDADANSSNARRLHASGSRVSAWIIPADEERTIAEAALAQMRAGP